MNQTIKESHLKYKVCVICHVPQSEAPGVLYAKFPQNVNRCRRWIRLIGDVKLLQLSLKKIQYRFVCGNHFLPQYFTKSGKHLTKDAIPTVFPHFIKPLKKDVVKLFPMLMNRTSDKVLLQCTQRIVPIKRETESPDSTMYEYLEDEFQEHMDPEPSIIIKQEALDPTIKDPSIVIKQEALDPTIKEPSIIIKQEALDPSIKECLPKIIPILHHSLPPNSQTTEIYTINKDRQVIPITTKVLHDGKECIIELSQKKMPIVPRKPKVIPVSNKVLSTILRKDVDVQIESLGYNRDAIPRKCLPKIIPILHHSLPPNSQTTEIYTINKDRQVIPITTKVLHDGKECIIELSQKKMPIVPRKPKVIPVSNKVLSTILRKDVDVQIESLGYNRDAIPRSTYKSPQKMLAKQKEDQMQNKIDKLQRRNRQLKRILKNICIVDEITSPNIKRVIEKAISNKQLTDGINEFTREKELAVAILKRGLNAYQYLSCLIPLPNVCALQKIAKGVPASSNTTKCRHLL